MAAIEGCWNNLPSVILYEIFSYLSFKDKIRASSTCHNWRFALYHPSFWKNVHFKLKSNDQNSIAKSQYLASCSARKLRNATVTFNSMDPLCVEETAKVIENLSDNSNLRSFFLIPSHCSIDYPGESCKAKKSYFERRLSSALHALVQKARRLEALSLGCLEELTTHSKDMLELVAQHQSHSIEMLGLASLKDDPDDYVLMDIDTTLFRSLHSLQILSLDYDYVNDDLLSMLSQGGSLQRLIFHVHGILDGHPGTTEAAWSNFTRNNPKCGLRISLIHSYDGVDILHSNILKRAMPLTHLRAFFCEQLNLQALHLLHVYHETLCSVWWVDSFKSSAANTLLGPYSDDLVDVYFNPFVMCCWRCTNLQELVLLGYKNYAEDVYAMTRLRGTTLKRLQLAQSDLMFSSPNDKTLAALETEASEWLGKPWTALKDSELHSVIISPTAGDSDEFILPVVLQDLVL